jgi:hypothetical protein
MKISVAALMALPLVSGFVSNAPRPTAFVGSSRLGAAATVVTGPGGKAASTKEEDMMLTLQIIMDHANRSSTASKDQYIAQMIEMKSEPELEAPVDISIPYDAAAKNAYEKSDKSMEYAAFKTKFEADAVAAVIAKQPKKEPKVVAAPTPVPSDDISIPYDAAAKNAYEKSDKSMEYAAFKTKFEADAVAAVIAKQPKKEPKVVAAAPASVPSDDISIPYDAAAKNAYEKSDKSMEYAAFKAKFEADAVADVIAKQKK